MIDIVNALEGWCEQKNSYLTIQKMHGEYLVGVTPFNGWMVYGKGKTLEEAFFDFLAKRKKNAQVQK